MSSKDISRAHLKAILTLSRQKGKSREMGQEAADAPTWRVAGGVVPGACRKYGENGPDLRVGQSPEPGC